MTGCSWMSRGEKDSVNNIFEIVIGTYDIDKINRDLVNFMQSQKYVITGMVSNVEFIYYQTDWIYCDELPLEISIGISGVRMMITSYAFNLGDKHRLVVRFEYQVYLFALGDWYGCDIIQERMVEFLKIAQSIKNELDGVYRSNIKVG